MPASRYKGPDPYVHVYAFATTMEQAREIARDVNGRASPGGLARMRSSFSSVPKLRMAKTGEGYRPSTPAGHWERTTLAAVTYISLDNIDFGR